MIGDGVAGVGEFTLDFGQFGAVGRMFGFGFSLNGCVGFRVHLLAGEGVLRVENFCLQFVENDLLQLFARDAPGFAFMLADVGADIGIGGAMPTQPGCIPIHRRIALGAAQQAGEHIARCGATRVFGFFA
jgi:hypothetical protein